MYPQDIAAVPDGGSHSRRSRLDRIWLEFLPLQGANQNLSAFSIARRCHLHPPRLPAGNCRAGLRPSHIWFEFLPPRVRTKTCPLFQSPVGATCIPRDCQREIVVRACVPATSGLSFCLPGCEPKPVRFFNRPSVPLASPATVSGKLSCGPASQPPLVLVFGSQGTNQNL